MEREGGVGFSISPSHQILCVQSRATRKSHTHAAAAAAKYFSFYDGNLLHAGQQRQQKIDSLSLSAGPSPAAALTSALASAEKENSCANIYYCLTMFCIPECVYLLLNVHLLSLSHSHSLTQCLEGGKILNFPDESLKALSVLLCFCRQTAAGASEKEN